MSFLNSIKEFYELGESYWRFLSIFSQREIQKLKEAKFVEAQEIFEKSLKLGYSVLCYTDENYPEFLRRIADPPCAIYVKGDVDCLSKIPSIAVVGSRCSTCYGTSMAFEISYGLTKLGAIVVSGGAVGADASAHKGAIKSGGQTIAVLACGIDYPYLMQNAFLRYEISQNGALVSEYPPGYPVQNFNFPVRNRLISALSMGVLVIEAGLKSGAIITANFAAEQNRDVFVIPVLKENPMSEGIFSLIDDGAKVITNAKEIINEYIKKLSPLPEVSKIYKKEENKLEKPKNLSFGKKPVKKNLNLPENLSLIIEILKNGKKHIDEIKQQTDLPTKQILVSLTKLEILGLIESLPGRFYSIK
ncbi:MAG: DNA-processing protein DprA [Oscillospiraceae bacterium]|nr:DNA-processing protein DprA [Oscillospiraceae bacterium]